MVIAAAIACGFKIRCQDDDGPNAYLDDVLTGVP